MSNNKMQQDSTELTCLNLVKESYRSNTCLFGLENNDKNTLWHLLENCTSNKGTKFPDFIDDHGLLNIFKFHHLKQRKKDKSTQDN